MKTTRSAMFFFQVSPFTDMEKRDGFWCVKTYIRTYCILFLFLLDSENKEAHL